MFNCVSLSECQLVCLSVSLCFSVYLCMFACLGKVNPGLWAPGKLLIFQVHKPETRVWRVLFLASGACKQAIYSRLSQRNYREIEVKYRNLCNSPVTHLLASKISHRHLTVGKNCQSLQSFSTACVTLNYFLT